jgi:hypothetical protein
MVQLVLDLVDILLVNKENIDKSLKILNDTSIAIFNGSLQSLRTL